MYKVFEFVQLILFTIVSYNTYNKPEPKNFVCMAVCGVLLICASIRANRENTNDD